MGLLNYPTFAYPAFDPDSRDAELLAAYEKARAKRARAYQVECIEADLAETLAAEADAAEEGVYGNFATTPEGIRSRLQLSIVSMGDVEPDMLMRQDGLLAVYHKRDELLDGNRCQLAQAAYELLEFEWSRRLDEYRASAAAFELIIKIKDNFEQLDTPRKAADAETFQVVAELLAEAETHFSNCDHVTRLMRTPVPDHEALPNKIEITNRAVRGAEAMPWIARDVAFLRGQSVADGDTHINREAE